MTHCGDSNAFVTLQSKTLMAKERLSDHMKQRYELHLREYKSALEENIELPLASFCRDKDIDVRSFTSWLSIYKKTTPWEFRNSVRASMGMKPLKARGQLEYDKHLDAYKKLLAVDLDYSLTQYCSDVGMAHHGFSHWLNRRGLNVEKIKQEVCADLGLAPSDTHDSTFRRPKPTEPGVFRRALSGFKKMLEKDRSLTLQQYCRAKGYAYRPLLAWMREIGIKPADIRAIVSEKDKLPKDNRRVFIQFKPNGSSSTDVLNGVRISLPDGTQIDVESCTVVGLCSFVNIYSKQ